MHATDAFWHLSNFFAPALFLGALAAALTKVIWRRELAPGSFWRLWAWASAVSALVSVAGFVVFGRDGRMATYAAMVVGCAVALWWAGFRGGSKP